MPFLKVPFDERSRELTTVNTPHGLYQCIFLLFGLVVSLTIFRGRHFFLPRFAKFILVPKWQLFMLRPKICMINAYVFNQTDLLSRLLPLTLISTFSLPIRYRVLWHGYHLDPNRFSPLYNAGFLKPPDRLNPILGPIQQYFWFNLKSAARATPEWPTVDEYRLWVVKFCP